MTSSPLTLAPTVSLDSLEQHLGDLKLAFIAEHYNLLEVIMTIHPLWQIDLLPHETQPP